MMFSKQAIKNFLGELPYTAELYWQFRQGGRPLSKSFSLRRTEKRLPLWKMHAQAAALTHQSEQPRRITIFTTLRYWIEHGVLLGVAAAGLGHQPTLAYLPYANWKVRGNRFDLRRHNAYAQTVLQQAAPLLKTVSFYDLILEQPPGNQSPQALRPALEALSLRDVQYSLNLEQVDTKSELYRLRLERNAQTAQAALYWLERNRPDVLLTPNGSILEMGAVYQVARHLDIPVVTYEFGEQRDRIWLAHNDEVMRQDTDTMWQARAATPLDDEQQQQVRELFASRQRADLWQNFSRRWQGQPGQGGEQARQALRLDQRPIILLAANVIGDSLTLNRQVFTESMTDWLQRTVRFFCNLENVQLVVRIHPGERYTQGPSVAEVVRDALGASLPAHIHLVAADAPLNTYDLLEIADAGLVYTTTVGMEMAMSGVPAVVAGQTHYRGRGFTLDPQSWQEYEQAVAGILADSAKRRLSREQVDAAWRYAYRFFFEYPRPFPWHLLHFWNQLEPWPISRALSEEGLSQFGNTFTELFEGRPQRWLAS
jgi:hypothetical protein